MLGVDIELGRDPGSVPGRLYSCYGSVGAGERRGETSQGLRLLWNASVLMCESDLVEGSTGIVTFLFTDVEGSTRGWQDQPEAMALGVAAHDDLMRASIEGAGGRVFALGGDSFAAAFETADAAVGAAVSAQRALGRQDWPTSEPIRVRMGVHTGPAEQRADNFFGPTVNRAARLMSAGHGGQILVSEVSASLLEFDHGLLRLGERRLADVDGVDVVYQVGAERFPPLRAVRVFECDVPVARTELIGRDDELAAIDRALRESRLVTLVGAGGTGKTRLAFEAARAARARFEAGVRLVDLTVVGEADEVAPAVAAAVDAMIGIDGWAAAIGAIGNRNTLLVFDNCEHLIEEVADGVDELLSSCQNLTVLATSREPLEIGGEAVRPVPPLDPAGSAIDLFCVRVRAAGVDPDQFDPADVAELCARLDGLPLALELAAGRARTLSPTELIERLDQGGDLETGRRRRRRRHDTLEDTIAWSYDLLDDDERTVLRRCSIFEGEFVLRGIETTAGLSQGRTVAALEGLVAKSLVIRVHGASPADASRYRLLETIRDFATRRLGDDNGRTVALDGLVDYLIGLYDAWLAGESRPRLLDELGLQRTTIATAARHVDATGRLDALGDVLQLWMLIWMTGSFATEPLDAISVDRVDELPGEVRGQLIVQSGIRCLNRGDVEGCQRDIAQTLALSAGRDTAHGAVALSIQSRLVAYIDPDAARDRGPCLANED